MQQLVPLTNAPNQSLIVPLNIDGVVRQFYWELRYNEIAGYWALSISDSSNTLIIDSLPLITGDFPAGNVLGQFAHLGIGSIVIVNAGNVPTPNYPDGSTLGTDFVLVVGDTPS